MITREELLRIMPLSRVFADGFISPLNGAMLEFEITTPLRMAAFLAQVAHESGELRYVRELASGAAYDTRTDLGNTPEVDGDGEKYKGRGLIQVTGKTNYAACSQALFGDGTLLTSPELLETNHYAAYSAGWFWNWKHLNGLADKGDFRGITKKVNGGYRGMESRLNYYHKALRVLGEEES